MVSVEFTFGQESPLEYTVPFPNGWITRSAKFSALAWISIIITEPISAGGRVIAASALFTLEQTHSLAPDSVGLRATT